MTSLDVGSVHQVFDLVVHDLGEETSFLDEEWASDRVLTAIDKAKVHVDRGLQAPMPWPIPRSSTGVPMVFIWSTADLQTLAGEIEAARARVTPELSTEFAAIATRVRGVIDSGKQIVGVDWQ